MVVVHEFGHFTVAKLCKVRVEAFSFGFGPRLFGYFHAIALYALDRFDEAARSQTLCAQIMPTFGPGYTTGAASDIAMGRTSKARERIEKLLQIHRDFSTETPFIINAYPSDPDLRVRLISQLREAGLP